MINDRKLNILVLHALGDPELAKSFLINHVFCLKNYFPLHNYLYHDAHLPLPDYAKDYEYDGIILDVTYLCYRWKEPYIFEKIKAEYSFLSDLKSFKIALPQDEYDCNELLDEWMTELGVDVVYSVCNNDRDVLYPKYHKTGKILSGFTGYIDKENIFPISFINSFDKRKIDVGYRARRLPYYFGRLGQNKWEIADLFLSRASKKNLNCDISVREEDSIVGTLWYEFINNCKFTLGANSGSSLLDPRGEIQRNVNRYVSNNPSATFEEVEKLFFPGKDGKYVFTAISPRLFEAGLLKSGLLFVKGDYSGIIEPWEHYIPLEPDCSNIDEVYDAMCDVSFTSKMIDNCYDTLLNTKELRYEHLTNQIFSLIWEGVKNKNLRSHTSFYKLSEKYNIEMPSKYEQLWRNKRRINKYKFFLKKYPPLHFLFKSVFNFIKSNHGVI